MGNQDKNWGNLENPDLQWQKKSGKFRLKIGNIFGKNLVSSPWKIQVESAGKSELNIGINQVRNWENQDPDSLNVVGEKLNSNFFICF